MARFRYRALQPSGATVEGEVEAADRGQAVERLQQGGTYPIDVEPAAAAAAAKTGALGPTLRGAELALFTRQLAGLVGAGMPLDRALAALAALRPGSRNAALAETLRAAILAGDSLSGAASRMRAFPPLYSAIIAAGEARGDLAGALERLAAHLERARAVRDAVVSALVYPASVTAVALLSSVFLLAYVVPRFETLLIDLRRELPPATRALVGVAHFLQDFGLLMLAALLVLGLALPFALRDSTMRLRLDRFLIRLALVRRIEAERFARLLGTLLASDLRLPQALAIAMGAAANRALAAAIDNAGAGIERGDGVGDALAASGMLPPLVPELARVGEESGRLPDMLLRAADVLKQEIEASTTRLVALLTPAATILLGLLVGALILGVFNAILEVYDFGF